MGSTPAEEPEVTIAQIEFIHVCSPDIHELSVTHHR
jgi:hypothetical protein